MCLSLKFILKTMTFYTFISLSLSHTETRLTLKEIQSQTQPEDMMMGYEDMMSAPPAGWVDPFDMMGERHSRDSLFVQSDVEIHLLQKRCKNYDTYLRRFVNLFLNAVQLRDTPIEENSMNLIKLEFIIHGRDINTLKEFGQGGNNIQKIDAVSDVFTKIFSQKTPQDQYVYSIGNVLMWFQRATLKIISSPEWTVLSSVALMLFLTLWLICKTHSYRLAIFTVMVTIFLGGFGTTWIRMYEEKEVEKYVNIVMNGPVPRHCSSESQSMAWYEHMYYRMFGVDCLEFYKSRDVRPIVKVSPTEVLAETFSSMFVNPAVNIGSAYGNFISSLLSHLPWWLLPIGLPLSFILPLLFIVTLFAFLFDCQLSLSITGFHVMPSWTRTSHMEKENRYVEECSRKENDNSEQSNLLNSILSNTKTPLFIMNWMGVKKLSSGGLLSESGNKDKKEYPKESLNEEDNHSLEGDNEEMMANLNNFKEFIESMESQKAIEECKERRLHTSAEGESSMTSRRTNIEGKPLIGYTDLYGDTNKASTPDGMDKEYKHKTT